MLVIKQPDYGFAGFLDDLSSKGCTLTERASDGVILVELKVIEPKPRWPDGYFRDVSLVLSPDRELRGVKIEHPVASTRNGGAPETLSSVLVGKHIVGYELNPPRNYGGFECKQNFSVSAWGGCDRGTLVQDAGTPETCLKLLSPPFLYGRGDVTVTYRRMRESAFFPFLEAWDNALDHLVVYAELKGDDVWGTVWMNNKRKELPFTHNGTAYSIAGDGDDNFTVTAVGPGITRVIRYPKQVDERDYGELWDAHLSDAGWVAMVDRKPLLSCTTAIY
ncbi:MAG: hypothetical protein HYY37_04645 [Candidatus Aenigmarchaeota archaeon]|nr:hypothetical protein [Candidatus Aenigmarchaeota archaeon]